MSFWHLHIHLVLFMMLALVFTGCSTTNVQIKEIPGSVRGIEVGDRVTVVLDFEGGSPGKAEKLEKSIGGCISDAMVKRKLSVRFIDPGEFRRAVFFDKNITSAPWDRQLILELLSAPYFREKIKSLDLRYLITVEARTESVQYPEIDQINPKLYAFRVHKKNTELVADIIDLQKAPDSGEVRVTVEDRGYYGCLLFLPVVIPAFTENRACKTLGQAVTKFLLGEKTGELSK